MIQTIVTSLFHGHSVKTDPMPDFNLERYLGADRGECITREK